MVRKLVGLVGLVAALFPDKTIDLFEAGALENPDECTVRPWINTGIRAEGIVVTAASLIGGRAYAWLMNLTGVFGAVVVLFPRLYREFATALLYEEPETVEWNDQFTDGVRIIGVLYVLMAIRAFRKRRASD